MAATRYPRCSLPLAPHRPHLYSQLFCYFLEGYGREDLSRQQGMASKTKKQN